MKRHFLFASGTPGEGNGSGAGAPKGKAVENQLIGQVDQETIDEWKKAHKLGIYAVKVKEHVGYFKMPGFDEMNCSYAAYDPEKVLAQWQALADVTWLGGSEELLTNPTLFNAVKYVLQSKADGLKADLLDL